jgi:hypothetical protein
MRLKESFLKSIGKCEPNLTEKEAEFLYNIDNKVPKSGEIVEIGSYKGGSAIIIAEGSNKKRKIYTIDSHPYKILENQLKNNISSFGLNRTVILIKGDSEKVADKWSKPISFLFIDGDHLYGKAKKDFILWEKYLMVGGLIAMHDSRRCEDKVLFKQTNHPYFPGSERVAQENILFSKRFKEKGYLDTIAYGTKTMEAGKLEKIKNNLLFGILKVYDCYYYLDSIFGKIGIFIKKHDEKLYLKLKKILSLIKK